MCDQDKTNDFPSLRDLGDQFTVQIRRACKKAFPSQETGDLTNDVLVCFTILSNQLEAMPVVTREIFLEKFAEVLHVWKEG
jgi:hypothetical protein